jgi:uncharacterized caspase-like protein
MIRRLVLCCLLGALASLTLPAPPGRGDTPPKKRGISERDDTPDTGYGRKWALVVGINYDDLPDADRVAVPRLGNAENDAKSVRDLLVAHYGYNDKDVVLLTGKAATREAIRDRLANGLLGDRTRVREDHCVLFFFAGHGDRLRLQDGSNEQVGVIFPGDVKVQDGKPTRASTLSLQHDVVDLLRDSPARHKLVILDSCHSGDIFSQQLPSRSRDDDRRREPHLFGSPAFQAIASARTDQAANDGRDGHSPFTAALLQALQTMPNRPDNKDYITASELFRFMYAESLQQLTNSQTPDMRSLTGDDGEFRFFPAGDFSKYLPQAQDYRLLQALVPGEYGNWWFDEVPWMIPSLRQAILGETPATRSAAGEKIGRNALWYSARRLRDKWSGVDQPPLVKLRLKHLDALHRAEQGKESRELYQEILKELQDLKSSLEAPDLHLLAVLQHSLGDREALESYRRALEKYKEGTHNEALVALCHADRAYCKLNLLGDPRGAAYDFQTGRKVMGAAAPPPFEVFVLCREADARLQMGAWGLADDRLSVAVHAAKKWDSEHALVAHALGRRGWASVEQWRFCQALGEFDSAAEILKKKSDPEARLALLDVQAGRAAARRFLGDLDGAVGEYRQLRHALGQEMGQLRQDVDAGVNLTEVQPRLLQRWVNTMEALADCHLFGDPARRDLKEASHSLILALRECYRLPGSAGKQIRARLLYKQALTLCLAGPSAEGLKLAAACCKEAAEAAGTAADEAAWRLDFYARLTPALVAACQSGATEGDRAEGLKERRGRLAELRRVLEQLRDAWQQRNVGEHLELLLLAGKVLVEQGDDADELKALLDTEMLLSFCRAVLRGRNNDTRAYLRPYYDAALAAKLRLHPWQVKELLEVQREATRGRRWSPDETGAIVALYVLGEKCYLLLDVPHGPSKCFCLADDYPLADIRAAVRQDRLLLPRDVVKELKKLPELGQSNVVCWWHDPLLQAEVAGARGKAVVQTSGFRGPDTRHFPFKLPDGLTEVSEPLPAPPSMARVEQP